MRLLARLLLVFAVLPLSAAEPPAGGRREDSGSNAPAAADVPYRLGSGLTDDERSHCRLDLYLPPGPPPAAGFPCLVWFHGGAIEEGHKRAAPTQEVAAALAGDGIAVVAPNYRLSPDVTFPAYIEDAAAAFAWAHGASQEHGLDSSRIYVGGHSAGAYLATMLVMDGRYLDGVGLKSDAVAGVVAVSGQMVTHSTVRKERGVARTTIVVDEAAPIFHARTETPPILALYADADLPCRAEENLYFAAALRAAGNTHVRAIEIDGRDHGTIAGRIAEAGDPARDAIRGFIGVVATGR